MSFPWPRPQDAMRATLALMLVGSFQVALAALFKFHVPETNRDMVIYMLGQLSGMVTTAIAFYFATSKSSADKNKLIPTMHDGKPTLDLTGAELPDDPDGGRA